MYYVCVHTRTGLLELGTITEYSVKWPHLPIENLYTGIDKHSIVVRFLFII